MKVLLHAVSLLVFVSVHGVSGASDYKCDARGGICQTSSVCSGGRYVSLLCAGAANRRCCIQTNGDATCTARGGTCQMTSSSCSGGGYISNQCAGVYNRKCCIRSSPPVTTGATGDPIIISRAGWRSRSTILSTMRTPVARVFIHHTAGSTCTTLSRCSQVVRDIQNYHINTRKWQDIGYSFLVGEDGRIYEGRGWDKIGAHTRYYNSISIAISFMGDFTSRLPNTAALNAAKDLIAYGVRHGDISSNYKLSGHRDARGASTACPGNTLYNHIKTWPRYTRYA